MNPTEWPASTDPDPMLRLVLPTASDRKRRLFAVACCRRVTGRLVDGHLVLGERKADYHKAVDAAARFADGRATERDMGYAFSDADDSAFCNMELAGAGRPELRKALFGDDASWTSRVRVDEMSDEDSEAFEAAADPAAWLESNSGEDDHLRNSVDPFRDVAAEDAVEVGETISRQVLLLVRTHLGREAEVEEKTAQAALIRDVFGDPYPPPAFDPVWRTTTVAALAAGIDADQAFDRMPVLADALEDAGCNNAAILGHCRGPGPHVPGCWVLDLVLGKN